MLSKAFATTTTSSFLYIRLLVETVVLMNDEALIDAVVVYW